MRAPPLAALLLHALFTGGSGSDSGSDSTKSAVKSPPTIRGPRCAVFDQLAAATIVVSPGAPPQEHYAARELADGIANITHRPAPAISLGADDAVGGGSKIAVGVGAALQLGLSAAELSSSKLGSEGFVATSNRTAPLRAAGPGSYALSGAPNATHGTLYAAYHLLHALGLRFFAFDAIVGPSACPAALPSLDDTVLAALEFRYMDGWSMQAHPQHAIRLHQNGESFAPGSIGVSKEYASPPGGVHTSYASALPSPATPPPRRSVTQPPLPALPKAFLPTSTDSSLMRVQSSGRIAAGCLLPTCGTRTANGSGYVRPPHRGLVVRGGVGLSDRLAEARLTPHLPCARKQPREDSDNATYGQLCWTNQSLLDFVVKQSKKFLQSQPNANILSISQNVRDPSLFMLAHGGCIRHSPRRMRRSG